jgi:hypothetical protein
MAADTSSYSSSIGNSPTSDSIRAILAKAHEGDEVTVDSCISALGDNSIPLALLLFTLLSSLPLFSIPGFTTVTGIPIILLGGQLLFAREHIWLPKRIRQHHLTSPRLWLWLNKILPYMDKIEHHLKPRMLGLSKAPMRRFLGFIFVIIGILLALPIPFINFPAGFSMFILAVGLVERDGLVIAAGLAIIAFMGIAITFVLTSAIAFAQTQL